MNIQEYLKQCSVSSIDELTDEQVIAFCTKENVGSIYALKIDFALNDLGWHTLDKKIIVSSIRKFLKGEGVFKFYLIDGESAVGPSDVETRWVVEP